MYQALAESLNLPAVAIVNDLGVDKAFQAGEKFGLDMWGGSCSWSGSGKWC